MPIYPGRRKGTHRITVWKDGRQHEEIFEGTRTEAREHEARLRVELGAGTRLKQRLAPSFSVFSTEEYTPHARAHLGADTWKVRRYTIATLRDFFGPHRLSELTTALVDSYTAERAKDLRATTINGELQVLGTMLQYARELGHPVAKVRIRKLRPAAPRVRAWTDPEVDRLLKTCRQNDPTLEPLLLFLIKTGCRKGEAIAALWAWVDLKRAVLSIGPYDAWAPKNKKPREIPIASSLVAVLRKLPRSSRWVFPNANGQRFAQFPKNRFWDVRSAAKVAGGPHTARHTFASRFLAAGGSMYDLSALMGHSATRTTELYAHLLPDHLERARTAVNAS